MSFCVIRCLQLPTVASQYSPPTSSKGRWSSILERFLLGYCWPRCLARLLQQSHSLRTMRGSLLFWAATLESIWGRVTNEQWSRPRVHGVRPTGPQENLGYSRIRGPESGEKRLMYAHAVLLQGFDADCFVHGSESCAVGRAQKGHSDRYKRIGVCTYRLLRTKPDPEPVVVTSAS